MTHIRKRGKTYSYTIDLKHDPVTGKREQINKGGGLSVKRMPKPLRGRSRCS